MRTTHRRQLLFLSLLFPTNMLICLLRCRRCWTPFPNLRSKSFATPLERRALQIQAPTISPPCSALSPVATPEAKAATDSHSQV